VFVFDLVGLIAAQDVIRNNRNLQKCEITQQERLAVLDGRLPKTPTSSNSPT
jgi:hypothetical protein